MNTTNEKTINQIAVKVENRYIAIRTICEPRFECVILNERMEMIKKFPITGYGESIREILTIIMSVLTSEDASKELRGDISMDSIMNECDYDEVMKQCNVTSVTN